MEARALDWSEPVPEELVGQVALPSPSFLPHSLLTPSSSLSLPQVELLLVSDCVYYEQSLEPLVQKITSLTSPSSSSVATRPSAPPHPQVRTMASLTTPSSTVVLSYERRPEKAPVYEAFFPLLEQTFASRPLGQETSEHGNMVYLLHLTKR